MKERGDIGEQLALGYLLAQGYQLIEQNVRLGHWEADLVMGKGRMLVVVEVKTSVKRAVDHIEARVSRAQFARLVGLATFLVKRSERFNELRVDLVLVQLRSLHHEIKHYKDISSYI